MCLGCRSAGGWKRGVASAPLSSRGAAAGVERVGPRLALERDKGQNSAGQVTLAVWCLSQGRPETPGCGRWGPAALLPGSQRPGRRGYLHG